MGLFYVSDLMGGAKNLLIGNVIKVQFLNIRDWPFGCSHQHYADYRNGPDVAGLLARFSFAE